MGTGFEVGQRNPNWRGGRHQNEKGYVRLMTREGRGKYEHRYVMEQMLKSPIGLLFPGDGRIPENTTVHHVDHRQTHNCRQNLMLLAKPIHDSISHDRRLYLAAHREEFSELIRRENEEPPDWVTREEEVQERREERN